MIIQDGNTRVSAKIDEYFRLHTYATKISEMGFISNMSEEAFSLSTTNLTFNSTNEHPILWFKNTNTRKLITLSSIIYSYNGGDINHNRVMIKRVYRNISAPTANYTEINAQNLHFGSLKTAQMTSYQWDESANDGMTIDYSGKFSLSTSTVQQGTLTLHDIDAVLLDFNASILFTFQPEEIGQASVSCKFLFDVRHCG